MELAEQDDASAALPIVGRSGFEAAINAMWLRGKALTRQAGAVAAVHRRLPMVEVDGATLLVGKDVPTTLLNAFMVEAPRAAHRDGRNQYRFIEVATNRPLAVRRRGSNAHNGVYYVNYDMTGEVAEKHVDTAALRCRLARLIAMSGDQATRNSALLGRGPSLLPRYVVVRGVKGSDQVAGRPAAGDADALVEQLNEMGFWPIELLTTSHPYRDNPPDTPPPGFVDRGQVGDDWDTSPFAQPSGPVGISTATFINNMSVLIRAVANAA